MPGYMGPVDWRDPLRRSIAYSQAMQNIVPSMGNFEATTDPEFDYLARAEALSQKITNTRNQIISDAFPTGPYPTTGGTSFHFRPPGNTPAGQPQGQKSGPVTSGGGRFNRFANAIGMQESGGRYEAVGVPTSSGTALGKYQILNTNFEGPGGWDMEAIGRDVSRVAFMNHPRLQERIARYKLRSYFDKYGAAGAASAWYSGDPGLWNDRSPQGSFPSIHSYVLDILRMMRGR